MSTVISVEHLSKTYRLGQIGTPSRVVALAPICCAQDATRGRTAGTFAYELKVQEYFLVVVR